MGVDCVISVDLQRPGQGHEACFFDNMIPVETLYSGDVMAEYMVKNISFPGKVAVVSATNQCVKKARRFQKYFNEHMNREDVGFAVYVRADHEKALDMSSLAMTPTTNPSKPTSNGNVELLLGDVRDCDVVIVDEVIDSATTLSALCRALKREGAKRIYLCASHGLFSGKSMDLIRLSPVELVVVTDSIPLPPNASPKVVQLPMAEMLAKIIASNVLQGDDVDDNREKFESLLEESEELMLD